MTRIRRMVIQTGAATATGTFDPSPTGVDLDADRPRGIRLLDVRPVLNDFDVATEDFHGLTLRLVLSNESELTPGLHLDVGQYLASSAGTTNPAGAPHYVDLSQILPGTLWVAKFWGLRVNEIGAVVAFNITLMVTYEIVPMEFHDQLLSWEQIDNVVNGVTSWWQP